MVLMWAFNVSYLLDEFASNDEFDDTGYRDMLLEYYVAHHHEKEEAKSIKLQAFYSKLKSTEQVLDLDERQGTGGQNAVVAFWNHFKKVPLNYAFIVY